MTANIFAQEVVAVKLLATKDVAEVLGVSVQYVHKLVKQGRLSPALPVTRGQTMWFNEADVQKMVASRQESVAKRRNSK